MICFSTKKSLPFRQTFRVLKMSNKDKQNIRFSNLLHSISGGSFRNTIDPTKDANALEKLKIELANSREFGFMRELLDEPVREELLPEGSQVSLASPSSMREAPDISLFTFPPQIRNK